LQAEPVHPNAHVVHHAAPASYWHTCPVVQSACTAHESQTRFVVPHVALDPVQFWYWSRLRVSDPHSVPVQPHSVAYGVALQR
jgi:hypothetical protein